MSFVRLIAVSPANDVGDTGAKNFAGALQGNSALRELYLHGT